jgi:DNA-binding response OmpR family regulator
VAKILVVEDDEDMAAVVEDALTHERHTVEVFNNGQYAWDALKDNSYELLVLDWELPQLSGIQILQRYRNAGGKSPVIMLTGKSGMVHKEQGFETGADDYLAKPFHVRELVMRVRALLRRSPQTIRDELSVGALVLETTRHRLTKNGVEIRLLPRDFALLEFFMRHPDEIFSSDTLLARVWHQDSEASPEGLRVAIRRVRKAIDSSDDVSQSMIENVPRVGYRIRRV